MASVYPGAFDSLPTTWNGSQAAATVGHAATHDTIHDAIHKLELTVGIAFHVAAAGAVGDGSTSDTAKIQAVFDAADAVGPVVYPAGTWLQKSVKYRGQSIRGAGMTHTNIKGMPGLDVFHADPTLGYNARPHLSLRDLTVTVDDSVDASASFPQRGGVGNACFALDYANGAATQTFRFDNADVDRVMLQSSSLTTGGLNKSCGFYFQSPANLSRFRNIYLYRLAYGYWDDYPTSNLTSVEFYSDHNHYDSIYSNGCGSAIRHVNHGHETITNLVIHGVGGTNGYQSIGVQSQLRGKPYNVTIDGCMIENVPNPWTLQGESHSVHSLSITGSTGSVFFADSYSFYDSPSVSTDTDNPALTITGNYNKLQGLRAADHPTILPVYVDQGVGNSVVPALAQTPPTRTQLLHTAGGVLTEAVNPMFLSVGSAPPTQSVQGLLHGLKAGDTVTGVLVYVGVAAAGSTPTLARFGLADSTGKILALSADLSAIGNWTIGPRKMPFTSPYPITADGAYFTCFVVNGVWATPPQLLRGGGFGGAKLTLAGSVIRGFNWAAQTDLPALGATMTITAADGNGYYQAPY